MTDEKANRIADAEMGTNLWQLARIEKEMSKVRVVAFEKKLGMSPEEMCKGQVCPGFQEIKLHWDFDVKIFDNFTRKARLVAGGHTTETPTALTLSSVVPCDSVVQVAFMLLT
jgi:hypothetical protein